MRRNINNCAIDGVLRRHNSCREVAAAGDGPKMIDLMKRFFEA